jgi:hypothetical protein
MADSDFPVGRAAAWSACYLLLCVAVGICAGVLWSRLVDLPGYTVAEDGTASTTERGLTEFFAGDAWYSAVGFFVAIGLGIIAWRWFGRLGWPVVLVAIIGAVATGLICWYVGQTLGPGDFEARLATARPGDFVPIELTVRSPVALLVWAFGAIIPVLLRSSLGRDEDEEELPSDTATNPTVQGS